MVASSANAAVATANRYTTCQEGMCLKYVHIWLEIGSLYPTAISAWNHARYRHAGSTPPRGAPTFWADGSTGAGHIALSLGGGNIRSTDVYSSYHVSSVPLTWIRNNWGLPYLGWSEDLNGVNIPWLRTLSIPINVSLSAVQAAAKSDPRLPTGTKTHAKDVLPVERALVHERLLLPQYADGSYGTKTIEAYAGWQRRLGYSGSSADGIPGQVSLTKLGNKYGFHVIA